MSRQGSKAAPAAAKSAPLADVASGIAGSHADGVIVDDIAVDEMVQGAMALPLHTHVAELARAALAAGRYADHSALHTLESALGAVRNRLAEAERILSPDYADLVARIQSVI